MEIKQQTLQIYVKPETDIVLLQIKGQLLQSGDTTFDTFSGGGDELPIGDGPDESEEDNRTNGIYIWDTL